MDLEGVLSVLLLLQHWRSVLCLAGGAVAAYVLVHVFPWLTGLQGIALAFLGLPVGVIWETRVSGRSAPTPAPAPNSQTSPFVAGACAVAVGAAWGGCSSTSVDAFMAGSVVFVVAAIWWAWYAGVRHRWASQGRVRFCVLVASLSYLAGAVAGHSVLPFTA